MFSSLPLQAVNPLGAVIDAFVAIVTAEFVTAIPPSLAVQVFAASLIMFAGSVILMGYYAHLADQPDPYESIMIGMATATYALPTVVYAIAVPLPAGNYLIAVAYTILGPIFGFIIGMSQARYGYSRLTHRRLQRSRSRSLNKVKDTANANAATSVAEEGSQPHTEE